MRLRTSHSFPRALGSTLLLVVPLGCSSRGIGTLDREHVVKNGPIDAGPETSIDLGQAGAGGSSAACYAGPAPAGASCTCAWADCQGHSLDCICAADCWHDRNECLIVTPSSGSPTTSNEYIASCASLSCVLVPGGGTPEFPQPDTMKCSARGCGTPPEIAAVDAGAVTGCPVPVPGRFTLSEPVWGEFGVDFRIPFVAWAFAVAESWHKLEVSGMGLHLRPTYFLATTLKESFMGCSDQLPAWTPGLEGIVYRGRSQNVDIDGCFQIESTTAWTELCRMFPNDLNCSLGHAGLISSLNQDALGRDNFVSSSLSAAYYQAFAFSLIQLKGEATDPYAWLGSAADPQAAAKVAAALYNRGVWGGAAASIFSGCHDTLIEQCEPGAFDYVRQVGAYVREMEAQIAAGNCYDEPVSLDDVDRYVAQVAALYAQANASDVDTAARAAFERVSGGAATSTFQRVASAVISAVSDSIASTPHCPEAELNQYYSAWPTVWHCP